MENMPPPPPRMPKGHQWQEVKDVIRSGRGASKDAPQQKCSLCPKFVAIPGLFPYHAPLKDGERPGAYFEEAAVLPCGHIVGVRCFTKQAEATAAQGGIPLCPECDFRLQFTGCGHYVPIVDLKLNRTAQQVMRQVPATIPEGNIVPDICSSCRAHKAVTAFGQTWDAFHQPASTFSPLLQGSNPDRAVIDTARSMRERFNQLRALFLDCLFADCALAALLSSWGGLFPLNAFDGGPGHPLALLSKERRAMIKRLWDESLLNHPIRTRRPRQGSASQADSETQG